VGNSPLKREIAGIALLLFALFLAGAVIAPPGVVEGASCTTARGIFGPIGACLRAGLMESIGIPAALLLPFAPAVHALRLFGRMESETDRSWLVFLLGVVVILPVALGLARDAQPPNVDPAAGRVLRATRLRNGRRMAHGRTRGERARGGDAAVEPDSSAGGASTGSREPGPGNRCCRDRGCGS